MEEHSSQLSTLKLFKSNSDKIIDGVCGGLAVSFRTDANVVRLVLIAYTLMNAAGGALFYLVAMVIIPRAETGAPERVTEQETSEPGIGSVGMAGLVVGTVIMLIGLGLLFKIFDLLSISSLWVSFGRLALPIIFILIGGALLLEKDPGHQDVEVNRNPDASGHEQRKLVRMSRDKKISGVCGGFAEYFRTDPTLARLLCVLLAFASLGLALVLYVACAMVIPKEEM
ncbi:MAG TPA: PspC domain-containing protein [Candidatus Kryptonia bacterium]